ncbi:MAG: pentapeptide repeat-containing protein [Bacteroidales bacterium]|nr:pentapeptide repeat-containing protein [Bacteroidales bacterium]
MRNEKKRILKPKYQLNSIEDLLIHIDSYSENIINLDECQINIDLDFRILLKELKKNPKFSNKIIIRNDINEFGFNVFYCTLKIPFRSETTIYSKGAYFELVEFEKYVQFLGAVFESDYSFKKSVFQSSANFSTVDFETKKNTNISSSFFRTIFKRDVNFYNAYFHSLANFRLATFYEGIEIGMAEFANIDLSDVEMKAEAKLINYHQSIFHKVNNRITGLYLKQHALKMNDSVTALKFKKMEMDAYRKSLIRGIPKMKSTSVKLIVNRIDIGADYFILFLNKISNSHGNSYLRGILFTLTVWFVFFSWFIIKRDGIGSNFIWTDGIYLKEAVNYFWLFSGIEGLIKEKSINWGQIFPFFTGKILIAYGIYQTIIAFRKYFK